VIIHHFPFFYLSDGLWQKCFVVTEVWAKIYWQLTPTITCRENPSPRRWNHMPIKHHSHLLSNVEARIGTSIIIEVTWFWSWITILEHPHLGNVRLHYESVNTPWHVFIWANNSMNTSFSLGLVSKVCGCHLVQFSCSPTCTNYIYTTKFVLHASTKNLGWIGSTLM
jgi:hypothetical protein